MKKSTLEDLEKRIVELEKNIIVITQQPDMQPWNPSGVAGSQPFHYHGMMVCYQNSDLCPYWRFI